MSLLTAIQQAIGELGVTAATPTSIIGNNDQTISQFLALATREARQFCQDGMQWGGWPELRKEYTFTLLPVGPYTGDTTINSNVLTNMSSTAGLAAPSTTAVWGCSGNGLLTGAQIQSVTSTTVTLNTPANSTAPNQSFQFGQIAYPLPPDIDFFLSQTFWDRNFRWQMLGPLDAQEWQTIVSGISPVGPRIRFRIMQSPAGGMLFWIQPPPGQNQNDIIAYEYISNAFCTSNTGTIQSAWMADTDAYIWNDDLLTLGLKWRFLRAKGLSYDEEWQTYSRRVDSQAARSGGNRALPLNASANGIRLLSSQNVPDTGFGS